MNATKVEEAQAFHHTMAHCNLITNGACLLPFLATDLCTMRSSILTICWREWRATACQSDTPEANAIIGLC